MDNKISEAVEVDLPSNRFELELEFVQCLASPAYVHHLAQRGYLSDPSFLRFLKYLGYWKRSEYARFLTYPHCLHFLDLLVKSELFRREAGEISFRDFMHQQQYLSWQYRSENLYGRGGGGAGGDNFEDGGGGCVKGAIDNDCSDDDVLSNGT